MTSDATDHWDSIWSQREPEELSWFQTWPERSLELIASVASPPASVIDAGGGTSSLVDALLDLGYTDLTVLDISHHAFDRARERLGSRGNAVQWIEVDVVGHDFGRTFDVWHDRAVFHFLVEPGPQRSYVDTLRNAVAPGGHVILATFGPEGPTTCSGLPVQRYGESSMTETLGASFTLLSYSEEMHTTPSGAEQQFAYGVFQRG